jgi:hypothetical protein
VSAAWCPVCGDPIEEPLAESHEHHVAGEAVLPDVTLRLHRWCHEDLHADDAPLWRRKPTGTVDAVRLGLHHTAALVEAMTGIPGLNPCVRDALIVVVKTLDGLGRLLLAAVVAN